MHVNESFDLATLRVTEITSQETAETFGGWGPFASLVYDLAYISAVLSRTEAGLEATGSTLGNGA